MTATNSLLSLLGVYPHAQRGPGPAPAVPPTSIPDPDTGRPLAVAAVDVSDRCVCPRCTTSGLGAYVSFVSDLRLAFACPQCVELIWIAGT